MMLFVLKYFSPKWVRGFAFFPFIFVKEKKDKYDLFFINHEKIHLRQQLEMLLIGFYIVYFVEFLIRLLVSRNWMKAYVSISFEKEAYQNEKNLDYLKKRSFWSFVKYF